MATVGSFGDIVFEVNKETVRTFSEVQRTTSARWGVHDVLKTKQVAEFIGPNADELSLSIVLNVLFLGGNTVESEIAKLREIIAQGKIGILSIGDEILGKYYLESMSENRRYFGKKGETLTAELGLTLKEFIERE